MIRVLIADDHSIVRRGLMDVIRSAFNEVNFGEASSSEQALNEVRRKNWDLIILDVSMPGRSGLDIVKDLHILREDVPILLLSVYPEDQMGRRALKAGASGYLNKDAAPDEIIQAIRRLLAGGMYVSSSLGELLAMDVGQAGERPLHDKLSNRELEVLRLMASGKSLTQISDVLHLGVTTVSTHRSHILEKLNLTSTAELINYAVRNQLSD